MILPFKKNFSSYDYFFPVASFFPNQPLNVADFSLIFFSVYILSHWSHTSVDVGFSRPAMPRSTTPVYLWAAFRPTTCLMKPLLPHRHPQFTPSNAELRILPPKVDPLPPCPKSIKSIPHSLHAHARNLELILHTQLSQTSLSHTVTKSCWLYLQDRFAFIHLSPLLCSHVLAYL